MPKSSAVWTYLKAVGKHWQILATSSLPIALATICQLTGHTVSAFIGWLVALILVLVAPFKAWQEQSDRADREAARADGEAERADIQTRRADALEVKVASAPAIPRRVNVTVSIGGESPKQFIQVNADEAITIERLDYMLSSGAVIEIQEIGKTGKEFTIPIDDAKVLQVWNTFRPDRSRYDHSGPAQLSLATVQRRGTQSLSLPVQMNATMRNSTCYRQLVCGTRNFNVEI